MWKDHLLKFKQSKAPIPNNLIGHIGFSSSLGTKSTFHWCRMYVYILNTSTITLVCILQVGWSNNSKYATMEMFYVVMCLSRLIFPKIIPISLLLNLTP
jgi:hypothetical protein